MGKTFQERQDDHTGRRATFWGRMYRLFAIDQLRPDMTIEQLSDSALAEFDKRFPAPVCAHVFTVAGGHCTECSAVMPRAFTDDLKLRPVTQTGLWDTAVSIPYPGLSPDGSDC